VNNPEFYIGYQPKAPAGLSKRIFVTVGLVAALCVCVGLLTATSQQPFDKGTFEFGVVKKFEGVLLGSPLPHIQLTQSNGTYQEGSTLLLVDQGKHGFPNYAIDGFYREVSVSGSLIYKDKTVMLELAGEETFQIVEETIDLQADLSAMGTVTLKGELVDTKCYLGVMRPGTGKVHRACAVNCLLGGVPPGILVRLNEEMDTVVLLTGPDENVPDIDPQWAGRMIEVKGELSQLGAVPVLAIERIALAEY